MKILSLFIFILFLIEMNEAVSQWNTSGSNIYNTNSGNVGIGNSAPLKLLTAGKNMTEPTIAVRNFGGTGGATFQMLDDASGADWKFKATNAGGFKIRDNGNSLDVIMIEPNSVANAIYINASGNIGLGVSNPLANLHLSVSGTNAYAGICLSSTLTGGKVLTINQGTASRLNFTEPGVIDLVTMDFLHQNVGINATSPHNSAAFEVNSSTKGMLIPRLTQAQIESINAPADGLQVYCNTDGKLYIFVALTNQWKEVAYGTGTITPFICGSSIVINHIAGQVAPVTKTVTYGTVNNVPGEPAKCWITSNLGADHQATAVDDATEASAGWYWQFNRKQGYKHDGTIRTPVTTWITTIDENLDWQAANDPCALLLGGGWRLPTSIEWTNVDESGGWSDLNGPWNSALKIHAAGYLFYTYGPLYYRGVVGQYWSSSQYNTSYGFYLSFFGGYCIMTNYNKTYGESIRCLRD